MVFVKKKASGCPILFKVTVQRKWSTCVLISDELSQVPGRGKDAQVIMNNIIVSQFTSTSQHYLLSDYQNQVDAGQKTP